MKKSTHGRLWLIAMVLIIAAGMSIYASTRADDPSAGRNAKLIASLTEKQEDIMMLTTAATAASAVVSAIPGDTATPIAEKLMELTSYLVFALGAVLLEKYIFILLQVVGLRFLIPLSLLMVIAGFIRSRTRLKELGIKAFLAAIIFIRIVPWSEAASNYIYAVYDESISSTIAMANEATQVYEEADEEEEDSGWWSSLVNKAGELVSSVTGAVDWAKETLSSFIEATVVMVITSCVIPMLTVVLFVILMKWLMGININNEKYIQIETESVRHH